MTDILAGNTIDSVNPFWGKWRITDGVTGSKVRPAAYKTGTTSDNKDVHAYGFLAMPSKKTLPALVAGVWMGNSDNTPNDGKLSLDTSAPAVVGDPVRRVKGMPIEGFNRTRPKGIEEATVDAFTGMKPNGATTRTVDELFLPGTAPTKSASYAVAVDIDQASGLKWREGCVGPDGDPLVRRLQPGRDGLQVLAAGRRRVAGTCRARRRRRWRPEGHPDGATSTAAASTRSAGRGAAAVRAVQGLPARAAADGADPVRVDRSLSPCPEPTPVPTFEPPTPTRRRRPSPDPGAADRGGEPELA